MNDFVANLGSTKNGDGREGAAASSALTTPKTGRASEDVALQLAAAIIDEKIMPGQRLPSERSLQQQFHTGRGVIREALRSLEQQGLVEIKKGAKGGAYVKKVEVKNVSESLALFLKQQRIGADSLIEFRESMDRAITLLAISRGEQEEKKALLEKTVAFERYLLGSDPDMAVVGEMDRELNILLARLAKNPIFECVMSAFQLGLSSHDHALYENPGYRRDTAGNWRDTVEHVYNGDTLKALASISYHYVMLRKCLRKKEEMEG